MGAERCSDSTWHCPTALKSARLRDYNADPRYFAKVDDSLPELSSHDDTEEERDKCMPLEFYDSHNDEDDEDDEDDDDDEQSHVDPPVQFIRARQVAFLLLQTDKPRDSVGLKEA